MMKALIPVWIVEEINGDGELTIKVFTTEQKGQIYQQQREHDLVRKQELRLDEETGTPNCIVHQGLSL